MPKQAITQKQIPEFNKDGEVVLRLSNGYSLRSACSAEAGGFVSGEYVRLCDEEGNEVLYWDHKEWQEEPIEVMGAIINAAITKGL